MAYAALASLEQTFTQILHSRTPITDTLNQLLVSIHQGALLLQSFLQRFPRQVNDFEGRIREVANKAEHLIEHLLFANNPPGYESINPSVRSEAEFVRQLREVAEEIESVGRDVDQLKLRDEESDDVGSSSFSRRRSTTAGEVIGFEDDLNLILDRLTGFSAKLQVVPILGAGGSGKTTLARIAYDHPLVWEHFPIRIWVTVSQEYSVKSIHSKLLASMKVYGIVDVGSDEDKIRECLKGGRYLIVMDDMWSKKAWDDVKMLFPDEHNGSRLILTTRLPDVAAYADPSSPVHAIRNPERFADPLESYECCWLVA